MAQVTDQQTSSLNQQQSVFIGQQPVPQNGIKLKGSGPRMTMGSFIIFCGVVQAIFGVVVIFLPYSYCSYLDVLCCGIWNGAFAIITGCFGVYSRRKRGTVIVFMVLAIIAALLSVVCCFIQIGQTGCGGFDNSGDSRPIIYIIMCFAYLMEALFCIIGASFTCIAICPENGQQVIVYQPYALPPAGQSNLTNPYTGALSMAAQPAPGVDVVTTQSPPPPAYQYVTAQEVNPKYR